MSKYQWVEGDVVQRTSNRGGLWWHFLVLDTKDRALLAEQVVKETLCMTTRYRIVRGSSVVFGS